jgi:mRNA interferase MazF
VIRRGEVWWASLPEPQGSEPGYRRPVLVVQSDGFNRSAIRTVVVVGISSNLRLAEAPGNVLLPKRETGLPRDSVLNVSQVVTLDKSRLTERTGEVDAALLRSIENGLRLSLDLW